MNQEPFEFTIVGQPATKKNSSRKFGKKVFPSEAYTKYESKFHRQLMDMEKMIEIPHFCCPIHMVCKYYLKDRAHWPDLLGLEQATADIISDKYKKIDKKRQLVRKWILADDRIIKSWDGSSIAGIDKDNPRVEIKIIPLPLTEDELDPYLKNRLQDAFFA